MAKDLNTVILLDLYGGLLTAKQFDMMSLYYYEDLSLGEIAENLGVTRQAVHKSIHAAEEYLRELEDKTGYSAHLKQLSGIAQRLEELSARINDGELTDAVNELKATL